jgi:hypothetical protein
MSTKFGQLFIHYPEKARKVCRIFISKNFPEREKILGKLFGIVEIETDTPEKRKYQIIDNIINDLENKFYYHEKLDNLLFGKPMEEISTESIFESTLQKLNDKIINLIQGGDVYLPTNKLHFIFGVQRDNYVYFTTLGQVHAFLIFEGKGGVYKMINIIEDTKGPQPKSSKSKNAPIKIFSSITSGKLNLGNALLFSTASLFDYLSFDRLKKVIATEVPNEAVESLKKILLGVSPYVTFSSIIIKFISGEAPMAEEIRRPQNSIKGLLNIEEKTEQLLSPSLKINFRSYLQAVSIKKILSGFYGLILKTIKNIGIYFKGIFIKKEKNNQTIEKAPAPLPPPQKEINNSPKAPKLSFKNYIKKISNLFIAAPKNLDSLSLNIIIKICRFFHGIFKKISKIIKNLILSVFKKINNIIDRLIDKFNFLPRRSKKFLVIFLIFSLLFLQSLVYLGQKREEEKDASAYNQIFEQIEKKRNEADASIIYNNEGKARALLFETQGLLDQLPQNTRKRKKTFKNLSEEIQAQIEKLRHVVNIPDPLLIVNLASVAQENTKIEIGGIINMGKDIYAFSQENNLYKINLDKREITDLNVSKNNISPLKFGVPLEENSLLFYTGNQGLVKFDSNANSLKPLEFPLDLNSEIKDIGLYNNRLYSLDIKNNQIYRYSKTNNGYSNRSIWLKERGADLTNGISLAINGSLYLLKSNGEIYKFNSGYKRTFESGNIDPVLKNPKKIGTQIDSNYLYVLDPPNKRLVVIDKEGGLKTQYYSDRFDDLKDLVIIEEEKKIYLLNGTEIFGIMASHL